MFFDSSFWNSSSQPLNTRICISNALEYLCHGVFLKIITAELIIIYISLNYTWSMIKKIIGRSYYTDQSTIHICQWFQV